MTGWIIIIMTDINGGWPDYPPNEYYQYIITGIYPIKGRVLLTDIKAAADREYQEKLLKEFDL